MAILITGVPGSGKSYKAMYDMYYQQGKYYKIFTNMDGLKQTDKILPLNFKKFTDEILTECYNLIVTQSKEYEEVILYLQRIYMLPQDVSKDNRIMLVIDESQNYFNKKHPVLLWFVTQHRHLYFELVLITQHQRLIHTDYHLFNTAYFSFPPVKQFSKKSIAYNEYAGLPMNDDNFVRKFSLKKEENVFNMYVSGDKVESPNILKRYILILLFFTGIVLAGIFYFTNMYGHSPPVDKPAITQVKAHALKVPYTNNIAMNGDEKLYIFVVFEEKFHILNLDNSEYMPLSVLKYIKKNYVIEVIEIIEHDSFHTSIYAIANRSLERLLIVNNKKAVAFGSGISFDSFKTE